MPDVPQTLIFVHADDGGAAGYTEDATIADGPSQKTNDGDSSQLFVDLENGSNNNAETRVLLRFGKAFGNQEGQVPANAVISNATLDLWITNEGGVITAHQVIESWDQDEVTWLTRGGDAGAWSSDGASPPSSVEVATADFQGTALNTATMDLTELALAWAADPSTNQGLLLRTESTNGTDIAASEYSETEQRPTLTVTYTVTEEGGGSDTGTPTSDSGDPATDDSGSSGSGTGGEDTATDTGIAGKADGTCGCAAMPATNLALAAALLVGLSLARRTR